MSTGEKPKIRVLSYNIHKGFSGGLPRFTLQRMRAAVHDLRPDLIFLQEVHGEHHGHRKRIPEYPQGSQFEYLAGEMWPHFSYGKNVVYTDGHHGNAILSKFPIVFSENMDVSQNGIERRGILHAAIEVPGFAEPLHVLCAHLGLFGWHRRRQLEQLSRRIETHVPAGAPVIAAGDFNDWRKRASIRLEARLRMKEAFLTLTGSHAKTFPSAWPLLCLDRIYIRSFSVLDGSRLRCHPWSSLSDHLAIWVELELLSQ